MYSHMRTSFFGRAQRSAAITALILVAALPHRSVLADKSAIVSAPDNKLNLRDGPSAKANIILELKNNTKVHILETLPNGWDNIVVDILADTGKAPSEQLSGFVNGKYLTTASVMATQAFRDGHPDRQAFETWFNGLSGPYHDGAEFWVSQRSDPNPPDCSSANDVAFRSGCEEAKKRTSARAIAVVMPKRITRQGGIARLMWRTPATPLPHHRHKLVHLPPPKIARQWRVGARRRRLLRLSNVTRFHVVMK